MISKLYGYKVLEHNASAIEFTSSYLKKYLFESVKSYAIGKQIAPIFSQNKNQIKKMTGKRKHEEIDTTLANKDCHKRLSESLILFDDFDVGLIHNNSSSAELLRTLESILIESRKPVIITSSLPPDQLSWNSPLLLPVSMSNIPMTSASIYLSKIVHSEKKLKSPTDTSTLEAGDDSDMLTCFNNLYDGDLRRITNLIEFWSYDKVKQTYGKPHETISPDSLEDLFASLNLISLEDLYQNQLDCEIAKRCPFEYDSYLADKRFSLVEDAIDPKLISMYKSLDKLVLADKLVEHESQALRFADHIVKKTLSSMSNFYDLDHMAYLEHLMATNVDVHHQLYFTDVKVRRRGN